MNKVAGSILSIILVLSFAMGIYCAGTNKTYDFKEHLESIAEVSEEIPSIDEVYYIWTYDEVGSTFANLSIPGIIDYHGITMNKWPVGGIFGAEPLGDGGYVTYRFSHFMAVDWGMFEPIKDVIDGIVVFTGRAYYTLWWGAGFLGSFFELVFALSPTSGIVERGAI